MPVPTWSCRLRGRLRSAGVLAKMDTSARRRTSSLPRITRRRLFSSSAARREVATIVSGAIRGDSTMALPEWPVTGVMGLSAISRQSSVKAQSEAALMGGTHSRIEIAWKLRTYRPKSAGRPVSRSIRFAVGGWVENRLPKLIPPKNGWMIKRCAVDGLAISGRCLE